MQEVTDLERKLWQKYKRVTGLDPRPGSNDLLHVLLTQCRPEMDAVIKEWDNRP